MTGLGLSPSAPAARDPLPRDPVALEREGSPAEGDRFRPDLEGLRAVAVLLVLLYHAAVPGFAGGYVGVDVFFVLSGFLITGLIVRELDATGGLDLAAFYARRARRLLPAAALVLVVTVLASAVLLPPLVRGDVASDAAASALYVGNVRFALQATDYLAAEQAPSPILHYWSLGVEEQFYLVWPALLLLTARLSRGRPGALWLVVAGVGGLSLGLSLGLTELAAPWAFFGLPTRAWELALGGLLALAARRGLALPAPAAALSALAGAALVVTAGVRFDAATPFPGTVALVPTVGAALVIAAGIGRPLAAPSRLLAVAPLRAIGRISYSLYLWHWPLLVIPAAAVGGELPGWARVALAAAAIPVAAASQAWVEEPIRRGRLVGRRPGRVLALAGALTLVVTATTLGVGALARTPAATASTPGGPALSDQLTTYLGPPDGAPSGGPPATSPRPDPGVASAPVPADLLPPLSAAREDLPAIYGDGCHAEQRTVSLATCVYGDPASSTTVVLFGDSKAAQWFPTLETIARDRGWRLVSLTKVLCAAVDAPVWNGRLKREYHECTTWRSSAVDRIEQERPDLIVVANSKFGTLSVDGAPDPATPSARWDAALTGMLGRLARIAPQVILVGDTPQHRADPPVCLSAHPDDARVCATPAGEAVPAQRLAADAMVAAAAGVRFVDPTPWVCPADPCPVVVGRLLVYHDAGHITRTYAEALAPYLAGALPPLE